MVTLKKLETIKIVDDETALTEEIELLGDDLFCPDQCWQATHRPSHYSAYSDCGHAPCNSNHSHRSSSVTSFSWDTSMVIDGWTSSRQQFRSNYTEVVSALKRRFGGTQQIISNHMEALLHVESLRRLFDNLSSHMRSLASLKVKEEMYGDLQQDTIWYTADCEQEGSGSQMGTQDSNVCHQGRDRCQGNTGPFQRSSQTWEQTASDCNHKGITHYLLLLQPAPDCTVVTQVDEWKQLLRRVGRCYSCLRRGHLSRNCWTSSRSQTWNEKSICSGSVGHGELTRGAAAVNNKVDHFKLQPQCSRIHSRRMCLRCVWTYVCPCSYRLPQLLSQTPWLISKYKASNCDGQHSHLTKKAIEKHFVSQRPTETGNCSLWIKASRAASMWGSTSICSNEKWCRQEHQSLCSTAHLCTSDYPAPRQMSRVLLAHFDLADDPMDETCAIDILIGSDFYWEFVTGEVVGGVAINTTLGWMLSGPADVKGSTVNLITTHTLRIDDGVTILMPPWDRSENWSPKQSRWKKMCLTTLWVRSRWKAAATRCRYHGVSVTIRFQPTLTSVGGGLQEILEEYISRAPTGQKQWAVPSKLLQL